MFFADMSVANMGCVHFTMQRTVLLTGVHMSFFSAELGGKLTSC